MRFTLPRDLYHGKDALEALKTLTGKKAIVVVGGGSMKRFGFLDKVVAYLQEAGMEVQLFEGVEPDPSVETVMKGAKAMEEFQPDWIVAVGGGSPIDAAKACKLEAADILNIKLMKCGGLYPAEKINAIAEANHVNCMVGCMLETKVAIGAGVALVAAKSNITEADCDSFMYAVDPEMGMPGGFTVDGGVYTLSQKPGLGLDIDF